MGYALAKLPDFDFDLIQLNVTHSISVYTSLHLVSETTVDIFTVGQSVDISHCVLLSLTTTVDTFPCPFLFVLSFQWFTSK